MARRHQENVAGSSLAVHHGPALSMNFTCSAYKESILELKENKGKNEFEALCADPACDRPFRLACNHRLRPVAAVPGDVLMML